MNEWDILQIEETADLAIIRKAYASLIKKYKPHTHAEMFKQIRAAYEQVIKSIEYNTLLDNGNDEDSIFQAVEQCNVGLVENNLNLSIESPEKNHRHEIKKFYIEHIMELYADLETKNNIEIWHAAIQRNSTELLMDDHSFDLILTHIIKSEYLYHSDLPLKPEIYILLFDFFNVDEVSYVSNTYSKYVSRPLLSMLAQHRYDLRLASIQESNFNSWSPAIQIRAENYYANEILNSSSLIVEGNTEQLAEYLRNSNPAYLKTLRNVVFKDILDKYISSTTQNDGRLIGQFYHLFRFKHNKKVFCKVFVQMGYSKEDIKNCLNFSKEMYIRYAQPPLWYRIIMVIPPLIIMFGFICWIYILIKRITKLLLTLYHKIWKIKVG